MHWQPRWAVAAAAAIFVAAVAASPARSDGLQFTAQILPADTAATPAAETPDPPAPPPKPEQPETGKPGTPAMVFDPHEVETVLGKLVRSSTGEDMGRLVDVLADHQGQARAAIIDFGGFLGVGSRKIAVDWAALDFARGAAKGVITVQLTRDQVKAAPEFKDGSPVVVLGASSGAQPPAPATSTPPAATSGQSAPAAPGQSAPSPPAQAREK